MSDNDSSSHSDYDIPSRGVISSGKGWQGEEMELEHARQQMQDPHKPSATTAVDLSQFRNEEIGQGYQAKFVVRQRQADDPAAVPIRDMTGEKEEESKKSSRKKSKRKREKDEAKADKHRKSSNSSKKKEPSRLDRYLQCAGLRAFRKELEQF